ncbi:MAG: hypothetical protein AUJ98_05270 [Bacteroidetes bacterium CG2_30_33_31]|nr:MAG: hypothetical protein AUJ98_05270 [Bacteroidetes bacterium CG2_30_33_31]
MKAKTIISLIIMTTFFLFSNTTKENEWKLFKSIDGINIYTQVQEYQANNVTKNYLIFKYENTNNTAKVVNWRLDLWYNGVCRACNLPSPNEYELTLTLDKGEVITGKVDSESKIFSVFYSSTSEALAPLDKFELTNLTVKN